MNFFVNVDFVNLFYRIALKIARDFFSKWKRFPRRTHVNFVNMAGVSNPGVEHDAKTRGIILHIVEQIKREGVFDRFRRDCLEELDSKVVCPRITLKCSF